MKVSAIQPELIFNEPEQNEQMIERLTDQAIQTEQPDTIVLPEMWNVSFFPEDLSKHADKDGQRSKVFLSRLSKKHKVNIVGGTVATVFNGSYYNTGYQYDRKGQLIGTYHKVHLFSPSGEHEQFTPGQELGIFEIDGVKAGIATCYDLRFTEWIRMLALKEIEILFVPAAWPHPRVFHWETLLKARAIENQVFVAGVNGAGKTDKLAFCGHSLLLDPLGNTLANAEEKEQILTAEFDLPLRNQVKSQINVFQDRRPDLYQL
ncbi:carbon-nitrogen family hydrolase [Marinilactibacillus piezotolerans]|uniref:carbon-nitrogen family hydrolase n=1 Tax=Marinilactibacillus piezotolerans TaxID=258723 RepID=UPI0009B142F8|nr:carbon-nitrogen family hydrolase [Marinilactibacillus piezotolerans]